MNVLQLDYHRNGISGRGFHVGIVQDDDRTMLVVRFPKEDDDRVGNVLCAAFDLAQLDQREIRFFHNSWRGDHYSDVMDQAIAAHNRALELKVQETLAIRALLGQS